MSDPILEAVKIQRLHPDGQGRLLDDVSVAVRAGRALSVSGSSGAGKTLLLRALAMLDPVNSGEIRLRGVVPRHAEVPKLRRQVIYLHQRPVLPGTTVEAVLQGPFSLAVHRDRRFDVNRVVEWFEQFGRDASFLDKPTAELSGGEQQIVALVRAVQLDPTVMLLDEPTASLDRAAAASVERFIMQWLAQSPSDRTFVWISHDPEQAERMTHERVVIDRGRIVEEQG